MKQSYKNFNFYSNPSVLGADRLWADGIDKLSREDTTIGNDYDGI